MKDVIVVEDVTARAVACDSPYITFERLDEMQMAAHPQAQHDLPVRRYTLKVHEFRGGPFGEEGVRMAFTPELEQTLGLPLRALADTLRALTGTLQTQRAELDEFSRNLYDQHERLCDYNSAPFWRRLKWAFTGKHL